MKRSTHQFSSPPLLEPAPNAKDGDDSSWPRSGLIIITRGVTVIGKQGFPRRTVEDKTHGASSDVGSQDGECSERPTRIYEVLSQQYPGLVNQKRVLLQQDYDRPRTAKITLDEIEELSGIELLPHAEKNEVLMDRKNIS
ncbi:hypothetical protein EVAR_31090_1 [Eumeta japonica]|uniref:Uncharacterized protein n=1 Tax=Eumeta variegata TaxID=151549 RepID=A0A4C2A9X7_EUMVA|nr:hypothetical protein EVAR_31090_1 [Eumeta japonica]